MLFTEKQYKLSSYKKIKEQLETSFPLFFIFDEMLAIVAKLNNQINCIDSNIALVGRNGTGKRTILKISVSLNKISLI